MTDSIDATRAQLEATLDAIEDKLNVPKQVGRLRSKAMSSYHSNPIPWIVGATAAVIAIGGIIAWAVLSSDD
ncbi:MAG: DUF3618 domain-containing protein [Actinomycetota bacterium]